MFHLCENLCGKLVIDVSGPVWYNVLQLLTVRAHGHDLENEEDPTLNLPAIICLERYLFLQRSPPETKETIVLTCVLYKLTRGYTDFSVFIPQAEHPASFSIFSDLQILDLAE